MTLALCRVGLALVLWAAGARRWWMLPFWAAAGALGIPELALVAAFCWVQHPLARAVDAVLSAMRRDRVRSEVPGLLTDLAMAAAAGQPLHVALRYAHLYADGPLAEALNRFDARLRAGDSVATALETLKVSLATPETDRLIALLARDAQLGLPLKESVARYRRNWLSDARREAARASAYLPYVLTTIAGVLLLEGVSLVALPWFLSLWRQF